MSPTIFSKMATVDELESRMNRVYSHLQSVHETIGLVKTDMNDIRVLCMQTGLIGTTVPDERNDITLNTHESVLKIAMPAPPTTEPAPVIPLIAEVTAVLAPNLSSNTKIGSGWDLDLDIDL